MDRPKAIRTFCAFHDSIHASCTVKLLVVHVIIIIIIITIRFATIDN
jgi:hypothetical protein